MIRIVGHELRTQFFEHVDHVASVFFVSNRDAKDVIGIFAGQVGEALDTAVGKNVHCAVFSTQHRGPEIDFFNQAAFTVNNRHVINSDLILHHKEQAAQHVLDDTLRPESDSDPGDSCTGQQRPDVEVHFFEYHQPCYCPDENKQGFPGQAADGCGAVFHLEFGSASGFEHHSHAVVSQREQDPAQRACTDVGKYQDEADAESVEGHRQVVVDVQQLDAGRHLLMIEAGRDGGP